MPHVIRLVNPSNYGGEIELITQSGSPAYDVMAGGGNGYAPGALNPSVAYNASLYQDGDRPTYARAGNVVDVLTASITGSSVDDLLYKIDALRGLLDAARDVAMDIRRRSAPYMRMQVSGATYESYAVVFGGSVQLPDNFLDAATSGAYTVEGIVVTIEREALWRRIEPYAGTPTALITPSATLTTGNYNMPHGSFDVSPATQAPGLAELIFSPVVGGAYNIGNLVIGARSTFRNIRSDLTLYIYPGGILEAESGTLGTDASLQADATASPGGGGNTKIRISYATASNALRLTVAPPVGQPFSGTYRVFARVKLTAAATVAIYAAYARSSNVQEVVNSAYSFTGTSWTTIDLGLITADTAAGATMLSPFGVSATDILRIYSSRSTGAGSLDIDSIILVPADEYYLTWNLASSSYASQVQALLRASTMEPYGTSELIALETATSLDSPTSHIVYPTSVGTGALYIPPNTSARKTYFTYVMGDSSWVNTWSPAGANAGVRFTLNYVPRTYGLRGT